MPRQYRFHKVLKVGTQLGFLIPVSVARQLNIKRGDYFDLVIGDQNTIIAKRLKVVAHDQIEEASDPDLPKIDYGK